jgi:hypothetical protein
MRAQLYPSFRSAKYIKCGVSPGVTTFPEIRCTPFPLRLFTPKFSGFHGGVDPMMAGFLVLFHVMVKCSEVSKERHALSFGFTEFKWTLKLCLDVLGERVLSIFQGSN